MRIAFLLQCLTGNKAISIGLIEALDVSLVVSNDLLLGISFPFGIGACPPLLSLPLPLLSLLPTGALGGPSLLCIPVLCTPLVLRAPLLRAPVLCTPFGRLVLSRLCWDHRPRALGIALSPVGHLCNLVRWMLACRSKIVCLWLVLLVQCHRKADLLSHLAATKLKAVHKNVVPEHLLQFFAGNEAITLLLIEALDDALRSSLCQGLDRWIREIRHREGDHGGGQVRP
mmetsp:Transcript_16591/g.28131  ORF Transcript_16591/g.28131 Transcript_16591/m.28131 type:complete len:228 (+) Transcript_16591:169-852(+)